MNASSSVKVIGSNGQISLGKQFAGRQVLVEEQKPGVWLIRTATIIPDDEAWIHTPQAALDLKKALDWALANPPNDSNTDEILRRLASGHGDGQGGGDGSGIGSGRGNGDGSGDGSGTGSGRGNGDGSGGG